jgi:hypothetical protein
MIYEDDIHKRVWAIYEAYKMPDTVMFHIANEAIRGPKERVRFKEMGGIPGVPDFFCGALGKSFFLELKRPDGRLSKAQKELIPRLAHNGMATMVEYSTIEAVRLLQNRGVIDPTVKFS